MLKFWKKKPASPEAEGDDAKARPDEAAGLPAPPHESPASAAPDIARDVFVGEADHEPAADSSSASDGDDAATAADDPGIENARIAAAARTRASAAAGVAPAAPVVAAKKSWRERFAGSVFNRDIRDLFARHPKLDDALLDELETILIRADVGVAASTALVEDLRRRMDKREFADAEALLAALRADLVALLQPVAQPLRIDAAVRPFVILMVGVNGVGKTTTIGKLARRLRDERRSVMLAAGDTFRAAAIEQLTTWGERNGVPVIAQGNGADAASVIFDAMQSARSRNVDVLIADTAGRLHTQSGLMDELAKIRRVLGKLDAAAPHEVLLVIDGTTGQNAVSQTRQFRAAIGVTGLVVTKLDGTAKGGVVFALAKEFGLPIRYVGLGETAADLREFDPAAFVDALLPARFGAANG